MDVSPVRSSSKCGSDFSIDRILSSDSGSSREQTGEVPSWLCCTRYQPPRLPRTVNACRVRRSGRHARVPFTAAQAAALEAAYARAPYLAPPALRALASALQLRDDRIKIWFQNRRARERREKSATITPPRDIALPPTRLFKTQAPPTQALHTWSYTRTEAMSNSVTPSVHTDNRLQYDANDHLQFDDSRNDYPKDLTVAGTSLHCLCTNTEKETTEHERETPLDIETVED